MFLHFITRDCIRFFIEFGRQVKLQKVRRSVCCINKINRINIVLLETILNLINEELF